jgi:hypothetical protein
VIARYTDTNNTKNLRAYFADPVYQTVNIENVPTQVSKVFVTMDRVNFLDTDSVTITVNGQVGSQVLNENEYTELDSSIGPIQSVTIGLIPSKLEASPSEPFLSGISLRFF